jgi:hypothetical protein
MKANSKERFISLRDKYIMDECPDTEKYNYEMCWLAQADFGLNFEQVNVCLAEATDLNSPYIEKMKKMEKFCEFAYKINTLKS